MIAYNPREWFGLIFRFHKSDTFRQMFWVLFFFAIATVGLVYLELHLKQLHIFSNTIQIHSLLGFVIALLMVFRTNTAYERWWEGRKLWGALVNNSRNMALKMDAAIPLSETKSRQLFRELIPVYVFAMKEHLRDGVHIDELPKTDFISQSEYDKQEHIPNLIAGKLFKELHRLYREQIISGDQLITLDKEIKALTDIIGACERIRNTPIPFSYNLFLKKFIFAYTITLPFGLAHDFHYWTVPIATFVLYVFGSIELLAEEIEDPFGKDTNDLPTDHLAIKIQKNVKEILAR
ncbi:MAG: bestrophin family ion channel [Vicingaceae bacterium]